MARRTPDARSAEPDDEHDRIVDFGSGAGSNEVTVVPWALMFRRRLVGHDRYRWVVLWTVLAGLFSVNVTFTILAVALDDIASDLGTTENTLTWVITAPLLAFGVAAPALGKAGDMFGHKRVYLLGMAGALVCALGSALAWGPLPLIAIRALGGLEGAATGAASMALVMRVFDRGERVKAMGWWSLVGAGGPVLGVVIGGFLLEIVSWRILFLCQMPLVAVALVLGVLVLPETARSGAQRFDIAGAATLALGITALLFAINRGPELGWSHWTVTLAFALSPVFLGLFVRIELRTDAPLISLDYLRRRAFVAPVASQALANFAYMGGFILAPSLLQSVYGYGDSRVGLTVIARPLSFSLLSPIAGYLAVRIGDRTSAVAGTAFVAASMLVFASLGAETADWVIIAALALSGVGLGVSSPSIAASVANSVDDADLGIASAAQQLMTQVGLVAGIQLMKTVQSSITGTARGAAALGGYRAAYLLGAAVCAAGIVLAAGTVNTKHTADS